MTSSFDEARGLFLVHPNIRDLRLATFAKDPSDAKRKVDARLRARLPIGVWQYYLSIGDMKVDPIGFLPPEDIPPLAD